MIKKIKRLEGSKLVYIKNLDNLKCHQQDRTNFCGAACAQMALHKLGLPLSLMPQAFLYSSAINHNTPWLWGAFNGGIDPSGLLYLLNSYYDRTKDQFFVYQNQDIEQMTRLIVENIIFSGGPVLLLSKNAQHWILVRGVQAETQPVQNQNATIFGLYINDPWPNLPSSSFQPSDMQTIPPHYNDDICGHGTMFGGGSYEEQKGVWVPHCNAYIPYDSWWQDIYLTPVNFLPGCEPKLVAILNKFTPKEIAPISRLIRMNHVPIPEEWKIDLGAIIPVDQIKIRTLDVIRAHGLQESEVFSRALVEGQAQEPIMVQRIDKIDSYYYLVPIGTEKSTPIITAVDAVSGKLLGAIKHDISSSKIFKERREVVDALTDRYVYIKDLKAEIQLRKDLFYVHPKLVWKLCEESQSPFYPFRLLTVGDKNYYIGYDGTIYSELHDIGYKAER